MRCAITVAAVLLSAASAAAQTGPDWDKLVAAAKTEGSVTFYTGLPGNPSTARIGAAFEKKYGVRMNTLEMRATELRERIRTEGVAGRVLVDVVHTAGTQTRQMANEDGTIAPYGPIPNANRVRSELQQGWEQRDMHIPVFLLNYGVLINTALVPDPPQSFHDLLDPKWKGKILADDFRAPGGGSTFFQVTYAAFGRAFHDKLLTQAIAFTRDQREAERRVARGEYAMYLPFLLNYLPSLKGLPVRGLVFKEGMQYLPYSASTVKNAPHPNAGRLLIDFMLSDEAQAIYAREGLLPAVDGLSDKLPAEIAFLGDTKLLGTSVLERIPFALKTAQEIYK